MRITSYGAAGGVTGSKHLVEINGYRILFDCGMFQGHRLEAAEKNKNLPFNAQDIHAVVVSHAHIDHTGVLPVLARHGYMGRVYATPATRDLCAIMLLDSSHIQERDARWLSRKQQTFVPPIYTDEDVHVLMKQFVCFPYEMPFEVAPGITVTYHDAGHVLGSAMCEVSFEEDGKPRTFIFSGDIGRRSIPILRDPWKPTQADVVMMESTYGNRDHGPIETLEDDLARIVNETIERKGKLIVPTFALERAQEFIYALKIIESDGRIPALPVFVDSPLTLNITEVFRSHTNLFDDEIRDIMEAAGDPFRLQRIKYTGSVEESMAINDMEGPLIVIAASGMCEYGRVVHHLKNGVEDDRNTVLIIGFQAAYTLGRRIVERQENVRILGMKHRLRAHVEVLNSLSAHAGRADLLEFASRLTDSADQFLLVHGEPEAAESLKEGIESGGARAVQIMEEGKTIEV